MVGRRWNKADEEYLINNYPNKKLKEIARHLNRTYKSLIKKINRLKITISSKEKFLNLLNNAKKTEFKEESINYFLAGLIAGEGSFTKKPDKGFVFSIKMADRDKDILDELKNILNIEVIEKHLKVNGKIIKNGDIVRFNCGKDNSEYCGYFYMANDLNRIFCDFLISDKRKEDWKFWDGYSRGFNFGEVKNFVKDIEGLR